MASLLTGHQQIHRVAHEASVLAQLNAQAVASTGMPATAALERIEFLMVLLASVTQEEWRTVAGNCQCNFPTLPGTST